MTLTPGTRLGSYEITSLLGAGGMGEVYRAQDTKLGRDIAIQVLPEAFAQDKERLARFAPLASSSWYSFPPCSFIFLRLSLFDFLTRHLLEQKRRSRFPACRNQLSHSEHSRSEVKGTPSKA